MKNQQRKPKIGNVRLLESGMHQARYTYRYAGECKTFPTRDDACDWLDGIYGAILQRKHTAPSKKKFAEVAEEFLREIDVREGTLDEYRGVINNLLLPRYGKRAITEINATDVRAFRDYWLKKRDPLTVRKYKAVLSTIFNYAALQGYIDANENPCPAVKVKAPAKEDEDVFLTMEQVVHFAASADPQTALAIKIMAFAGLRADELWDLKVKNVDLESGWIRIVSSVRRVKGKGLVSYPAPKNGKKRAVRIPVPLIADLKKQMDGKGPDDLLMTTRLGTQIDHSNWSDRQWARALEFAKLPETPRVHDLRHTCAALYFQRGATGEEVRKVLGHSSIETTHKHYAHLFPEAFDRIVDGIDEQIASAENAFATQANALVDA